eukprot:TRINITY_DN8540_c0_g1_i2.p1 TRINITY_DN8540_c0_g1~~TRINITY_DN8540_c0_g1_i2.p1  ORF type:complete len:424 (+),score=43.70 TRINITY_DN8540_c0_g1_i2:66-1337(+)
MDQEATPGSPRDMADESLKVPALLARQDWNDTLLGCKSAWPQELCTMFDVCMSTPYAQCIYWGSDFVTIFNESWRSVIGIQKSAWAMGKPAQMVWPEIWSTSLSAQLHQVHDSGKTVYNVNQPIRLNRHGYEEEAIFDYSFSPIYLRNGSIGGVWNTTTEKTNTWVNTRRLKTLSNLIVNLSTVTTTLEACIAVTSTLQGSPDVCFSMMYLRSEGEMTADLVSQSQGQSSWTDILPQNVDTVASIAGTFPIGEVFATGVAEEIALDDPIEPVERVMALPITSTYQGTVSAVLVMAVNKYRPFDHDYRNWFELIASHVTAAFNRTKAKEDERKFKMFSEMDKAKTTFFGNVSHEFRTPLNLMLGPLELVMADPKLPEQHQETLRMVYRNGQRLLKLVNSLLDFSRIEADRFSLSFSFFWAISSV